MDFIKTKKRDRFEFVDALTFLAGISLIALFIFFIRGSDDEGSAFHNQQFLQKITFTQKLRNDLQTAIAVDIPDTLQDEFFKLKLAGKGWITYSLEYFDNTQNKWMPCKNQRKRVHCSLFRQEKEQRLFMLKVNEINWCIMDKDCSDLVIRLPEKKSKNLFLMTLTPIKTLNDISPERTMIVEVLGNLSADGAHKSDYLIIN